MKPSIAVFLWYISGACSLSYAAPPPYEAGKSYFGSNEYIEYIPGDMPFVITVPHGGTLKPDDIPDRGVDNPDCPKIPGRPLVRGWDVRTREMARDLQAAFHAQYGVRPYFIINHLSRNKADMNRGLWEATCKNPTMEKAWNEFHTYTDQALKDAIKKFGGTFYVDLHGHGHKVPRFELGYLITAPIITQFYQSKTLPPEHKAVSNPPGDTFGAFNDDANLHSMANFPKLQRQDITLFDVVFGDTAYGTLLMKHGLRSIPSRDDPFPGEGEPMYEGGYNTERYTGKSYPKAYGVQIETHSAVRNPEGARAMADATMEFLRLHGEFKWKAPTRK